MHKWPGIILAVFMILFSVSGIIMNHRNWFSKTDVSRSLLPPGYQFNNWNLAAVKGAVKLSPDNYVLYGNIGVWLTNDSLTRFTDLNRTFPKGIDNRKTEAMLLTSQGVLLAGTLFGLYRYDGISWNKINLPDPDVRITDLTEVNGVIYILTRSHLITSSNLTHFTTRTLPATLNDDNRVSLFRTLWTLHSGELFGHWGKIVVDLLALALIFLSITGILHWLFPKWIKRRKTTSKTIDIQRKSMIQNLKLHNKVGYVVAAFLVVTAITGMFLRPPLLISIATAKVKKVPYSILDNDNPWNDKLRRIIYLEEQDRFLVSTSDGFVLFNSTFTGPAHRLETEPPVSVMGCTVLEKIAHHDSVFLVGSFTGLFYWDVEKGFIANAITGMPYRPPQKAGSPISENMISGYVKTETGSFLVDYRYGMQPLTGKLAPPAMPQGVIDSTPISLWNVALEVHTGRIFEHLLGPFYILYVPLVGFTLLMVLISGFFIWWLAYRRKKRAK